MPGARELAVTAGLSVAAMVFLFGAVVFWITAGIARDPQTGGSVTVLTAGAVVSALVGATLLALAVRRVHRRFRPG